jgi:indole-3-acetate O-methyltransferase
MEAAKAMAMQGGDGEGSYLQNSGVQSHGFQTYGKPCLARAIELYKEYNGIFKTNRRRNGINGSTRSSPSSSSSSSSSSRLIRIADYGCSYGWNTLDCMRFVIDTMLRPNRDSCEKDRLESSSSADDDDDEDRLQFQYFFVDLPSNDFNSLFRMLHDLHSAMEFGDEDPRLFSSGIAGSFYECVLPPQSVDVTIAMYSMHWLSQVRQDRFDRAEHEFIWDSLDFATAKL